MIVSGPAEFAAAMRELERVAAGELDAAMVKVSERTVLPVSARLAQGKAGTGALGAATRVVQTPRGVEFVNRKVYANVQHYGGQTWNAASRVGRSANQRFPGPGITGKHFVTEAVRTNPAFDAGMQDALNGLVEKFVN